MGEIIKNGFVIVQPLSIRDEDHKAVIWGEFAPSTFGATESEAWRRQVRDTGLTAGELAMRIQRWHDRGYRVKAARIVIYT